MSNYRRVYIPGGCYFFTVVCRQRRRLFDNPAAVNLLRQCMRQIKTRRPFEIQAIAILPDHLHCIWRLPDDDSDYSARWREIKKAVSRRATLVADLGKPPLWQNRFWEHLIVDENDWRQHIDYIHFNPVKHGLVQRPGDWPLSSFQSAVRRGWYPADWGAVDDLDLPNLDLE